MADLEPYDLHAPHLSYSYCGEDLVLEFFFRDKLQRNEPGFFVDIGAYHPTCHSNTYYFYRRGWRGVNIEPTPGAKALFDAQRPGDVTVEKGVSSTPGVLKFYVFNAPTLNTFDKETAFYRHKQDTPFHIEQIIKVETAPLRDLLEDLRVDGPIDFMNIDVENREFDVLQSNDWERFRPRYLLIESFLSPQDFLRSEVYAFLSPWGYGIAGKTAQTYLLHAPA